jgi:hypothetical protein
VRTQVEYKDLKMLDALDYEIISSAHDLYFSLFLSAALAWLAIWMFESCRNISTTNLLYVNLM